MMTYNPCTTRLRNTIVGLSLCAAFCCALSLVHAQTNSSPKSLQVSSAQAQSDKTTKTKQTAIDNEFNAIMDKQKAGEVALLAKQRSLSKENKGEADKHAERASTLFAEAAIAMKAWTEKYTKRETPEHLRARFREGLFWELAGAKTNAVRVYQDVEKQLSKKDAYGRYNGKPLAQVTKWNTANLSDVLTVQLTPLLPKPESPKTKEYILRTREF